MSLREEFQHLIEQLSEQQLALLMPLVLSVREQQPNTISSEASAAYQSWVGAENDIYDELFADELATW